MSPRKRGMMPGCPETLGRSAWFRVGFRETTLSPSGKLRAGRSHPFQNSLGRNNLRSHQSDAPKAWTGTREAPGPSPALPSLHQELVGTWHWLPGAAAPPVPVVPRSWSPPPEGWGGTGAVPKPWLGGDTSRTRRHIQRESQPSSPRQGHKGGKAGGGFLRAEPGVWEHWMSHSSSACPPGTSEERSERTQSPCQGFWFGRASHTSAVIPGELLSPIVPTPPRAHPGSHPRSPIPSGLLPPLSTITTTPGASQPLHPMAGTSPCLQTTPSSRPLLVPTKIPGMHHGLGLSAQHLSQPRAAPCQPCSEFGAYLGVPTAIKTYRRYNNNNDGDNNSTFLCSEHR